MNTIATITHTNTEVKDKPDYQMTLSHPNYCKLQSMLILCNNTASGLTQEDKVFLRQLDNEMLNYRGEIGT
jgi:hypothetical protein